jgi:hypothetical protein
MKTTILIIGLFSFTVLFQAAAQQPVYVTAHAGLNLAGITSSGGTIKPGLNFGATAEYLFSSNWGAESGMIYSMRGTRMPSPHISPELGYLNIPVFGKYYIDGANAVKGSFFAFGGPQLDLAVSRDMINYRSGHELEDDIVVGETPTKAFALSIAGGVGYLFPVGLVLSGGFDYGLTNIMKDGSGYHNYALKLNFGYRFSL